MVQRIAFLGSDNSHAEKFPEILNVEGHPDYWADSGARVQAIWGEDPQRTAEVARKVKIPVVASTPQEAVAESDMVFVIPRDGGTHLELARLAIEAGKPLFVDKPLTVTPKDAIELLSLVKRRGIRMTSFTTLRYGSESLMYEEALRKAGPVRYAFYGGPCSRTNPYGGLVFYAIHTVELMLQYHGIDVASVHAIESPTEGDKSNITATCTFGDGTLVTLALVGDGAYYFYKLAFGRDGVVDMSQARLNYAVDQEGLAVPWDHYTKGMREVLAVLRGEKPSRISHEEMLRSIQVCAAIEESLQRGAAVDPRTLR